MEPLWSLQYQADKVVRKVYIVVNKILYQNQSLFLGF